MLQQVVAAAREWVRDAVRVVAVQGAGRHGTRVWLSSPASHNLHHTLLLHRDKVSLSPSRFSSSAYQRIPVCLLE